MKVAFLGLLTVEVQPQKLNKNDGHPSREHLIAVNRHQWLPLALTSLVAFFSKALIGIYDEYNKT